MRYSAGEAPLLSPPSLADAAADAVDHSSFDFLLNGVAPPQEERRGVGGEESGDGVGQGGDGGVARAAEGAEGGVHGAHGPPEPHSSPREQDEGARGGNGSPRCLQAFLRSGEEEDEEEEKADEKEVLMMFALVFRCGDVGTVCAYALIGLVFLVCGFFFSMG